MCGISAASRHAIVPFERCGDPKKTCPKSFPQHFFPCIVYVKAKCNNP